MYMLLMVLDDATRLADVLEAWTSAGVRGVTILESTGLQRIIRRRKRARCLWASAGSLRTAASVTTRSSP